METVLTGEARARLDAYLDAVEGRLATAGHPREQRRGVVDDLESQILEMLRTRGATGVADVAAVIEQLDPPQAYGRADAAPAADVETSAVPRVSRMAITGAVLLIVSALLAVAVVALMSFLSPRLPYVDQSGWPHEADGVHPNYVDVTVAGGEKMRFMLSTQPAQRTFSTWHWSTAILVLPIIAVDVALAIIGTVLGWIAFFRIRRLGGMLRGKGLAVFDSAFVPVAAVAGVVLFFFG